MAQTVVDCTAYWAFVIRPGDYLRYKGRCWRVMFVNGPSSDHPGQLVLEPRSRVGIALATLLSWPHSAPMWNLDR